jgi:hypothetical protein
MILRDSFFKKRVCRCMKMKWGMRSSERTRGMEGEGEFLKITSMYTIVILIVNLGRAQRGRQLLSGPRGGVT